jgi:hypothetical protein
LWCTSRFVEDVFAADIEKKLVTPGNPVAERKIMLRMRRVMALLAKSRVRSSWTFIIIIIIIIISLICLPGGQTQHV